MPLILTLRIDAVDWLDGFDKRISALEADVEQAQSHLDELEATQERISGVFEAVTTEGSGPASG